MVSVHLWIKFFFKGHKRLVCNLLQTIKITFIRKTLKTFQFQIHIKIINSKQHIILPSFSCSVTMLKQYKYSKQQAWSLQWVKMSLSKKTVLKCSDSEPAIHDSFFNAHTNVQSIPEVLSITHNQDNEFPKSLLINEENHHVPLTLGRLWNLLLLHVHVEPQKVC